MVPSTLRLFGCAFFFAVAALFALPAAAHQGRAAARPHAPKVAPTAQAATPVLQPLAAQPTRPRKPRGYTIARVRTGRSVALRAKPGGAPIKTLGDRTEFGSKRVLAVAAVRGRWLGVSVPDRPNGKLGWIDGRSGAIVRDRTDVSLHADVSRRTVELRIGRRTVKRMRVAVGRPGSPTPTGRFAITDKLSGDRFGPYYGCCILAISAIQPNLPSGWSGGNRMAVHGTNSPGTIGAAASAGCLRGADRDLRTLIRRVPVGAPIFIRR